jgi:group I intron endonuclease
MSDYSKSRIYKIYCDIDGVDEIYVGSSRDLNVRIAKHKYDCTNSKSNNYNFKLYRYIRDNNGWENFTVEILQRYSCENEIQLHIKEQEWIDKLKPTLNERKGYLSASDKKEYQKVYDANRPNKEDRIAWRKEIINCSRCNRPHSRAGKSVHMKSKYCLNYTAV